MNPSPTLEDLEAMGLTPEDLVRMGLIPEEQLMLQEQMAQAEALAQPGRRYSTPAGAAIGGIANILNQGSSQLMQQKLRGKMEKNTKEQSRVRAAALRAGLMGEGPMSFGSDPSAPTQGSPLGGGAVMPAQGGMGGGNTFGAALRNDPSLLLLSGDPVLSRYAQAQMGNKRGEADRALQGRREAENRRLELEDKASGNSEWDRRNTLTAQQEMERARVMAGQQAQARSVDRRENAAIRAESRGEAAQLRAQEKAEAAAQKNAQAMYEIETRFQNIKDRVGDVRKMVTESGTYELTGSHNDILNQKLSDIATDMAKVMDPTSVARESEVESAKKNLPRQGLSQSNKTALEVLQSFESDLDKRREAAYRVRGLTPPAGGAAAGGGGLPPEKKARLEELRAKAKAGGFR